MGFVVWKARKGQVYEKWYVGDVEYLCLRGRESFETKSRETIFRSFGCTRRGRLGAD